MRSTAAATIAVRRLFAGPDEVLAGTLRLPEPGDVAVASRSALHILRPDPSRGEFPRAVFQHGGGGFEAMLIAAPPEGLDGREDPDFEWRHSIEGVASSGGRDPRADSLKPSFPAALRPVGTHAASLLPLGIDGTAKVARFDAPAGLLEAHPAPANAHAANASIAIAWRDGSRATLVASRASWDAVGVELDSGSPPGSPGRLAFDVAAWSPLDDGEGELRSLVERARSGRPLAIQSLEGEALWSDGSRETSRRSIPCELRGFRGLTFERARRGDAIVTIHAEVIDIDGALRSRSVVLLTSVHDGATSLGAAVQIAERTPRAGARSGPDDDSADGWVDVIIPVSTSDEVVFAGIELWAVASAASGSPAGPRERPLCWLGGLAAVEPIEDGEAYLAKRGAERGRRTGTGVRLGCEAEALALAPGERIECREVRIHGRDGFRLLAHRPWMHATSLEPAEAEPGRRAPPSHPRWMGRPGIAAIPAPAGQLAALPGPGSHVHALVHGYCADANPWPSEQFGPERWSYLFANQNLSHDAFALDLLSRGADFKSHGVIGQSQGGAAALHLYAFYFSPLDWAGSGRLIQAVGTPFEGTPVAGVLAALAEIFGVQCGTNYDMSVEGATLWLSTIPMAARAKLFTHTTSYPTPGWSGFCNLATSFFLAFPEDGVTEHASGHIPGANDCGLVYGWCHVDGMRHPDQALDAARNATMRTEGAR